MDEGLIMEVWDIFKEYVPDKNKEVAANQYVDFLIGKDVEISVIESLVGYDPHLDDAIRYVLDQEESFEEEESYYDEDDET
jgi:hypothetical protein